MDRIFEVLPQNILLVINPATKDPKKGNAGYRRQSLIFLDAGSESGMTGWYIELPV